jgi:hypothetical protein
VKKSENKIVYYKGTVECQHQYFGQEVRGRSTAMLQNELNQWVTIDKFHLSELAVGINTTGSHVILHSSSDDGHEDSL